MIVEVLSFRLYQIQYDEQQEKNYRQRKQQMGTGNRNEKIRTYNIPQNRITDERLDENFHNVNEFLDGTHRLNSLIELLQRKDRVERFLDLTNK